MIYVCIFAGFLYAGLQNVFSCYCGLEYGKHGKLNVGVCTQRCPGDSGFYCGAQMANLVYGTRLLSLGKTRTKTNKFMQTTE